MKSIEFVVPLPPVTKKNSQEIVRPKGRPPLIVQNKRYKDYERACKEFMPKLEKPIDFPVEVSCEFYRKDKRRCDLTNLLAAITDVMVKYGVLEDDNYHIITSVDHSRVFVDPDNARTVVTIREV